MPNTIKSHVISNYLIQNSQKNRSLPTSVTNDFYVTKKKRNKKENLAEDKADNLASIKHTQASAHSPGPFNRTK